MRLDVVSIFPGYLAPLRLSLVGKAAESGLLDLRVHDLRDWTHDRHRTVDDTPAGGGAGMVMRPEPWGEVLDALAPTDGAQPRLVVPTPAGTPFSQDIATELAAEPWLLFACGRYEGIDQRVLDYAGRRMPISEVSIGDYVLAGGEAAVLVIVEAVTRLVPGVIGNPESLVEESHSAGTSAGTWAGLLEYPVYTRPARWHDLDIPEVLLSGHHEKIIRWRRDEALRRTLRRRPDLLAGLFARGGLDARDEETLAAEGWRPPG